MALPLTPPLAPQLARGKDALPEGDGWSYEPKWDGFRAIAFVDGDAVTLRSRGGKPLERYFPELTFPAGRYVLDGEIIIDAASGAPEAEDFDALSQRIHPAATRVERLAAETPARFVAFDLLALDDHALLGLPFGLRRSGLESLLTDEWAAGTTLSLTPSVKTVAAAQPWLTAAEGVVAKEAAAPYLPGERKGMVKVKRLRTVDCVIAGWRPGKEAGTVGSLMLGLYDDAGALQVIGHTSGLKAKEKRELVTTLAPYATGERGTAESSRWRSAQELEWVALRPELVVEVSFDQVSGGRIRHGAKLLRWRDDKSPTDCTLEQLNS